MDFIKDKIPSIGAFLAIAGILSSVLSFIGYNLRLLLWIDMWGPVVGWVIRIALIVVGGALFFFGKKLVASE
ncbi:MAG TPA: hypothetical protein PKM65_02025 [Spirochaetota bacterium]|nr:hypothetical protein [Spirochaetota bacterium]HNT12628.1 hypothetical protein [Spirochaetota bacterium]HNV46881.1 hypothetical protein [Spirochaetota bacterium]HPU89435.1 hypothetical protein [Spirochaetota bacterium]